MSELNAAFIGLLNLPVDCLVARHGRTQYKVRYSPVTARGGMDVCAVRTFSEFENKLLFSNQNFQIVDSGSLNMSAKTLENNALQVFALGLASNGLNYGSVELTYGSFVGTSLETTYGGLLFHDESPSGKPYELLYASSTQTAKVSLNTTAELNIRRPELASQPWWNDVLTKISGFSLLGQNWDSYRANRILPETMIKAYQVASQLAFAESAATVPMSASPHVAPLSSGGILFEIKNQNRELHVEVFPRQKLDFGVLQVSIDSHGNETEKELTVPQDKLLEVLTWIVQTP
jgi:hypothetical protein